MVFHVFSNNHIFCLSILIILNISHSATTTIPNESKAIKQTSRTHFLLVHGSCHGAWSWYKVRALLESAGHKVSSPDLLSAGIDPSDANTISSFQEYNKPVQDLLTSLPAGEKVIIVGHSLGGLSVSNAIHNFPDKILVGIYVVGEMQLMQGFNSYHNEQGIIAEEPNLSKFKDQRDDFDYFYGQGHENPPTSAIFKKEVQREILYNKSPLEDSTLAAMLLKPCPYRGMYQVVDSSSKVPRVFIRILHDNFVPIEWQNIAIKIWPPSDVYDVDSDHSPMLSDPSQLVDMLVKAATKFGPRYEHSLM